MPFIEVVNIHPDYEYSLSVLFQEHVAKTKKYTVILPEKSDSSYTIQSVVQAIERAKSLNAKYLVVGLVNVINSKVTMEFTMYDASNGSRVWNQEIKNQPAQNIELLIIQYAYNLGSAKEIYVDDGRTDFQRFAYKTFVENATFTFGAKASAMYIMVNKIDNTIAPGFGLNIDYDIKSLIFEFNYDLYFSKAKLANYNLGIYRPLFKAESTPYVGLNLCSASITADNPTLDPTTGKTAFLKDTNGGGLFKFTAGYIFSRTKETNFRIGVDYFLTTFEINEEKPSGFMANVSILLSL